MRMNKLKIMIQVPMKALWKTSKLGFVFLCIIGMIYSYLSVVNIYLGQNFFDSLASYSQTQGCIIAFIIYAIVSIALIIINGIQNYTYFSLFQKANIYLQRTVFEQIDKLEPICFEEPSILNHIKKAEVSIQSIFETIMTIVFIITFYLPYIILLTIYFYKLQKTLPIILVFIFVMVLIPHVFEMFIKEKLFDDSIMDKRKYEYYGKCIGDKEFFKETRYLGATNFFMKLFIKWLNIYQNKAWRAEKKIFYINLFSSFCMILGRTVITFFLVHLTIKKYISIGMFAAIYASLEQTIGLMDEMLNRHLAGVLKNSGLIKSYITFMMLPKKECNEQCKGRHLIELKNISFKYPHSEEYALKNINFCIDEKQTIAIVGRNGSGKSTLAKILLGIYKPTFGEIYGKYNSSAVFQDFAKYKMSMKANIQISDLLYGNENEIKRIIQLLDLEDICEGDVTLNLSKEFGGKDISGGQWQRVAIARGLYRKYDFMVLDEPTSAINPIEENKIYVQFANIVKGASNALITHRLGSIKLADKIIVLKNGVIVESGTHEDLMQKKNEYYKIYSSQAKWYQ